MARPPLLAVAWSAFVLAVHGDQFQVPTLVDPDCQPQTWDGVVCEISCNIGYESDCQDISWTQDCGPIWILPFNCTERGIISCSQLGPGFRQVFSEGSYGGHGSYFWESQKCCRCQSSQTFTSSMSRTTTLATTTTESATTTTTTTTSTEAGGLGRGWEFVGGPFNRACRGQDYSDNSPGHYDVFPGTDSLADCQDICLQRGSRCKGVEYSTGRCEVWHREEGIWAYAEPAVGNFTCMRYGWPAQYLMPVDTGVDRACRGDHPTDNNDQYYVVHQVMHMEDCTARCVAAPACFGIEYKGHRCEIWTRPIRASSNVESFTCLRYEAPPRRRRLLSLI